MDKIRTRVTLKHDTTKNWETIENQFCPMVGEMIVYDADENGYIKCKIGQSTPGQTDGRKTLSDLPFVIDTEKIANIEAALGDIQTALGEVIEQTNSILGGREDGNDSGTNSDPEQ